MYQEIDIKDIDGHGVGVWGGAPQGKKLFEVDTQGEKGRHPHLDTPKVKKKFGKLTPGVSTFSHFFLVKSPSGGRAGGKIFRPANFLIHPWGVHPHPNQKPVPTYVCNEKHIVNSHSCWFPSRYLGLG